MIIIVSEETVYSGIFSSMFEELIVSNKAVFINRYLDEKNVFRRKFLNFLYKDRLNSFLKGCFEPILHPKFSITEQLKKYSEEDLIVIFTNASLQKMYSEKNLKSIKLHYPNVRFILLLVDSIFQPQAKRAVELSKKGVFDLIYTYNKDDAKKLECTYWPTPYSYIPDVVPKVVKKGVYFCGSDKGRAAMLDRIADKFNELGVQYKFEVFGKYRKYKNFIIEPYKLKDYKEVLNDTLKYSVILDICQESKGEECGLSLRVYESFVYGRTLITNNKKIKDFEYYNSSYMHYISDENDIRLEWFQKESNSSYSNQLSPSHLIDDIYKRIM